jgi:hypothetical protein
MTCGYNTPPPPPPPGPGGGGGSGSTNPLCSQCPAGYTCDAQSSSGATLKADAASTYSQSLMIGLTAALLGGMGIFGWLICTCMGHKDNVWEQPEIRSEPVAWVANLMSIFNCRGQRRDLKKYSLAVHPCMSVCYNEAKDHMNCIDPEGCIAVGPVETAGKGQVLRLAILFTSSMISASLSIVFSAITAGSQSSESVTCRASGSIIQTASQTNSGGFFDFDVSQSVVASLIVAACGLAQDKPINMLASAGVAISQSSWCCSIGADIVQIVFSILLSVTGIGWVVLSYFIAQRSEVQIAAYIATFLFSTVFSWIITSNFTNILTWCVFNYCCEFRGTGNSSYGAATGSKVKPAKESFELSERELSPMPEWHL